MIMSNDMNEYMYLRHKFLCKFAILERFFASVRYMMMGVGCDVARLK